MPKYTSSLTEGINKSIVYIFCEASRSVKKWLNSSKKSQKRTKTVVNSNHPTWSQTFCYSGIRPEDLRSRVLEVTVWDYDRFGSNEFLGEVTLDLTTTASHNFDDDPIWHSLSLHENVGGDLTTIPPICHTPGLVNSSLLPLPWSLFFVAKNAER